MHNKFDVLIAGAGPAGSVTAYELARQGMRTLILEKEAFPRYKCCAGGVSIKTAGLLGTIPETVIENTIYNAILTFSGNDPYYGQSDTPIIHTVMRSDFDTALLKKAVIAGAELREQCAVLSIEADNKGVTVHTNSGTFKGQYLVGADGAQSIVSRTIGNVTATAHSLVTMEAEIAVSDRELERWQTTVHLDAGFIRSGYCWLFPKRHVLSLGASCTCAFAHQLKPAFRAFLSSLHLENQQIVRQKGGLIPLIDNRQKLVAGRILLVGDAAALADPLSGEGICSAVQSGMLAAPVLRQAIEQDNPACLSEYISALQKPVLDSLKVSGVLLKMYSKFPRGSFMLLKRDEQLWQATCQILRGETDYEALKQVFSLTTLFHLITG